MISISFKLMSFRDSWVNGNRRKADDEEIEAIQPIHLVLIEEPEAHLHIQVQQVFIKNAYDILRNNPMLKNKTNFSTQMIVSTHSSSIALECEFANLRYFRRTKSAEGLPVSVIINLSNIFGIPNQTNRFVARYLRTTHCDLFFADAAILIEGAKERIFMPYFIKKYKVLDEAYNSFLKRYHAVRTMPGLSGRRLCIVGSRPASTEVLPVCPELNWKCPWVYFRHSGIVILDIPEL